MSPITLVQVQAGRGCHTYDFGETHRRAAPRVGREEKRWKAD